MQNGNTRSVESCLIGAAGPSQRTNIKLSLGFLWTTALRWQLYRYHLLDLFRLYLCEHVLAELFEQELDRLRLDVDVLLQDAVSLDQLLFYFVI